MTASTRTADGRTGRFDRLPAPLPALLAVGVLIAALLYATGPVGLAIAALTAGAWALAPVPYALAAGHVALVALGPGGFDPVGVAVVEAGFLAVLVAALAREPAPRAALATAGLALLATGVVAWAALATGSLWAVAGTILLTLATIGYAIHRYQLVRFDLLADGSNAGAGSRPTPGDGTAGGAEPPTADRTPGAADAETEP